MSQTARKDEFNMTSFYGRFRHFINVTNPYSLIYSNKEVMTAIDIVNKKRYGKDDEFIQAKRLVDAAVHPATGDIIPRLFRVSAIAPVNIPIVFAMIACPASNVPGTLFLHFINQSYNTLCNYYNRSGSDQSIDQIVKAYVLAVGSACSIAYGLGRLVSNGPPALKRFGILIPCLSTAFASCSNLGFTRYDEIAGGVSLIDKDGEVRGQSKIAGLQVVAQTAVTRCVLVPSACLLLPPAFMASMKAANMLPKSRVGLIALELGVIYLSLQAAMPAALAIFPQTAAFDVSKLEKEFQDLTDVSGNKISSLYANKGL